MQIEDMKNWFFHYSHDILATPQQIYQNIVKSKNYVVVFFHSSQSNLNHSLVKKGLKNFETIAQEYKGVIQFGICDVDLEKECQELVQIFELEDQELPYVRVLYGMSGKGQ